MEAAIQSLSEHHNHVVVLHGYSCDPRIFVRLNMVDAQCYQYLPWKPESRAELGRWFCRGGVLINHTLPKRRATLIKHDALLFIECPLQFETYMVDSCKTEKEVVIYKPPVWDIHDKTARRLFCGDHRRIFEVLKDIGHLVTFEDEEVIRRSGMPAKHAQATMRALLRTNHIQSHWWPLALHLEPSDPSARHVYDALAALPKVDGERRLSLFHDLLPGQSWRPILKRLVKDGYVSQKAFRRAVGIDEWHPNFRILDAIAEARWQDWLRMRDFVDALPEYPIQTRFAPPVSTSIGVPVPGKSRSTHAESRNPLD